MNLLLHPIVHFHGSKARKNPSATANERPPNIIVIVADDLGVNDISTFGGGVAGGRVNHTKHRSISCSGSRFLIKPMPVMPTCAPSRAMIMTGRYPTRTGFEFTPTPSGMGPTITTISNSLNKRVAAGSIQRSSS